ncbi:MAG TPA: 30S ribosomal protein S16 [Patescibacteria group bacterium]|nr:30S ribosomal protein S16 [Patescibacteria group bacterium]
MVTIRLSRYGRKNSPFYRVVAVDSHKKRDGAFLEVLGFWNPVKGDKEIKKANFDAWVAKGAQVSATVKKLFLK